MYIYIVHTVIKSSNEQLQQDSCDTSPDLRMFTFAFTSIKGRDDLKFHLTTQFFSRVIGLCGIRPKFLNSAGVF